VCTLIAFHRVWRDAPLVVAANRDERYDRPATGPRWIEAGALMALAPRDDVAGGTWMGANVAGMWIGITNRRGSRPPDPDRRSRGLLCLDLLREATARDVVAALERIEEPYNPFHVVCGDGEVMTLIEYEEGRVQARELSPGCHIVTNEPLEEAPREPKTRRAWALLEAAGLRPVESGVVAPAGLSQTLSAILADHGIRGPDALCLHGGRYGTRSAAVWRLHPATASAPRAFDMAYAEGPPCATPFEPVTWPETA
jgi:uncharacterized protein with NRDE domain